MPNHIHHMWEQLKMNRKEFPKNSFEKYTPKTFINNMKASNDAALKNYALSAEDRQYNTWQKDPLAIRYPQPGNRYTKARLHAFKSNAAALVIVQ